jgi:hypothetical protein
MVLSASQPRQRISTTVMACQGQWEGRLWRLPGTTRVSQYDTRRCAVRRRWFDDSLLPSSLPESKNHIPRNVADLSYQITPPKADGRRIMAGFFFIHINPVFPQRCGYAM